MYRAGHDIHLMESKLEEQGKNPEEALLGAAQEFAIECAILKVSGSEALDYVADEGVQIFGGYGFSADYPMDRAYRDSRINRIFEGTNEINRLLTMDMLLKRAMKGELDLMGPAMAVQKELVGIPDMNSEQPEGAFGKEKKVLINVKKLILMAAGFGAQKFMQKLATEQEILMNISDMVIELYSAESALLRVEKNIGVKGEASQAIQIDIVKTYINDAVDRISINAKNAIELYIDVAKEIIEPKEIKRAFEAPVIVKKISEEAISINPDVAIKQIQDSGGLVIGDNLQSVDYSYAKCCNPIPGDDVFGFVSVSEGVKIHRTSCPNAVELMSHYGYRVIKVRWSNQTDLPFQAGIYLKGADRMGIVNDVTRVISNELKVNIRSILINTNDGVFEGKITLDVLDGRQFDRLCMKMKTIPDIISVSRII